VLGLAPWVDSSSDLLLDDRWKSSPQAFRQGAGRQLTVLGALRLRPSSAGPVLHGQAGNRRPRRHPEDRTP